MATPNWKHQTIWTGDNLYIMRGIGTPCSTTPAAPGPSSVESGGHRPGVNLMWAQDFTLLDL